MAGSRSTGKKSKFVTERKTEGASTATTSYWREVVPADPNFLKITVFLRRKTSNNGKVTACELPGSGWKNTDEMAMSRETLPLASDIEARLRRGDIQLRPVTLKWERAHRGAKNEDFDGVVRIAWQKKEFPFAAVCKRLANPKALQDAMAQAQRSAGKRDRLPLVIVPYLSERSLDELETEGISGIDLCGNGIIAVPGELFVKRTGAANRFQTEGVIKNVYRHASSVVARLFLAQPEFDSVQDALDELARRSGRVTLSTVSKVCKAMENDLILDRRKAVTSDLGRGTKLRLIQPEKLLERLTQNYTAPNITAQLSGKLVDTNTAELPRFLRTWAEKTKNQITLTGTSSVGAYAVMAREAVQEFYCTDAAAAVRQLGNRFQSTDRFPTIRFLETRNDEVYFDRRDDLIASPLQTYLELSAGDKRDKETAEQVKRGILNVAIIQNRKTSLQTCSLNDL